MLGKSAGLRKSQDPAPLWSDSQVVKQQGKIRVLFDQLRARYDDGEPSQEKGGAGELGLPSGARNKSVRHDLSPYA